VCFRDPFVGPIAAQHGGFDALFLAMGLGALFFAVRPSRAFRFARFVSGLFRRTDAKAR
jgi:hypothetical protein